MGIAREYYYLLSYVCACVCVLVRMYVISDVTDILGKRWKICGGGCQMWC